MLRQWRPPKRVESNVVAPVAARAGAWADRTVACASRKSAQTRVREAGYRIERRLGSRIYTSARRMPERTSACRRGFRRAGCGEVGQLRVLRTRYFVLGPTSN